MPVGQSDCIMASVIVPSEGVVFSLYSEVKYNLFSVAYY